MMAPILVDSGGKWGNTDATKFNAYAKWLIGTGVVVDSKGNPFKGDLPGGPLFTNDLLEGK
jgi:hypothetical protein